MKEVSWSLGGFCIAATPVLIKLTKLVNQFHYVMRMCQ